MALQSIIDKSLQRLESIPDDFIGMVNKQNEQLWKELLKLLEGLDVEDGVILANSKNLAQSQVIVDKMRAVMFGGEYLEGLKDFIGAFDEQAVLVNGIFAGQFDDFVSDNALYKQVVNQSKRTTLALFDQSAIDKAWSEPMKRIMQDNILVKGTYNELLSTLKEFTLGSSNRDAALTRYAQLYARDSFNIFNRNYTHLIGEDIGVEYYEYAGGAVKDSRDFCLQRIGRYFSKKEVESWASLSWQGKRPETDSKTIFSYRGGYNCMHSILPVSKAKAESSSFFNEVRPKEKDK